MVAVTTNVPLPSFTATGFTIPSTEAILAGVIADMQAAFGGNLNLSVSDTESLTTPQGQLASSWTAIIQNVYQLFQLYTTQVDPAYAFGRMQDAIARIYDLERDPSEPTVLQVSCSGLTGIAIPAGAAPALVVDPSGNVYACTGAVTIPAGGSATASFACLTPGPVAVPASVSIYQGIFGWDSATLISGVEGVDVESRQAFELRRQDTVAANSVGPITAVIGAVAEVAGVLDYYGFSNNTAGTVVVGGVTIAPNAIYVCVAGGAAAAIAAAILSKKSPGAPMTGNTSLTVYDTNPLYAPPGGGPYVITWQTAAPLQLLFSVVIVNGPQVPANAAALIQAALIAAVTQGVLPNNPAVISGLKARIGTVIYATTYIQAINALGTWAQVASIGIGSANTPQAVMVGTISGNTLTVSGVITGTVQVGQTLSDTPGEVVNGTQVTAYVGGTGGVGTYTVNNPQTVAGASFSGSGSGTTLTVTGTVTDGPIVVGAVIIGTGVPSNTTIIAQLTGTPGGDGTYQTSVATTASGTITTAEFLTFSAANQTLVSIQADQVPQLVAADIAVSVT